MVARITKRRKTVLSKRKREHTVFNDSISMLPGADLGSNEQLVVKSKHQKFLNGAL